MTTKSKNKKLQTQCKLSTDQLVRKSIRCLLLIGMKIRFRNTFGIPCKSLKRPRLIFTGKFNMFQQSLWYNFRWDYKILFDVCLSLYCLGDSKFRYFRSINKHCVLQSFVSCSEQPKALYVSFDFAVPKFVHPFLSSLTS